MRAGEAALAVYNAKNKENITFSVVHKAQEQIADGVRYNFTFSGDYLPMRLVDGGYYSLLLCSALVHQNLESELEVESVNCHEGLERLPLVF